MPELKELTDSIEGLNEIDMEFVTPDGKRWRIKQFSAVCHPSSDNDILECRLQEVKPPAASPVSDLRTVESK